MTRILCVCLGNICRSPTAAAVLRALAAREARSLTLEVDSAGTADYHIGEPPDRRSQTAAKVRGYDLSALRARQVVRSDFERFDWLHGNADDFTRVVDLAEQGARGLLGALLSP